MENGFERRRELISEFRRVYGRDPDDQEWLEIYAQVKSENRRAFRHMGMQLESYEVGGVRKVLFPENL